MTDSPTQGGIGASYDASILRSPRPQLGRPQGSAAHSRPDKSRCHLADQAISRKRPVSPVFPLAVSAGLVAGSHVATWGMYKDSPHEGFVVARYLRSVVLAVAIALVLAGVGGIHLTDANDLVPFFGSVYALERVATEFWKYVLREDEQSKYTIPMRMAVNGRVVERRAVRYSVGLALLVGMAATAGAIQQLQLMHAGWPHWAVFLVVGSAGGWYSAFGGAWKDAPIEGFDLRKFPRSPIVSLAWALVVARFTTDWLTIAVASAGYSVATIETYKKFRNPEIPPGKFANAPVLHPETLLLRRYFRPAFATLWLIMIATIGMALVEPHRGLLV